MVEEFWNELVELFMPDLSICPRSMKGFVAHIFGEALKFQGFGWIDWKMYPRNRRINNPTDIIPILEQLLDRPLQEQDKIVYIYAGYDLEHIIKTQLEPILEHYREMPWTDKTWIWNPEAGYVIEDQGSRLTVGIIPKYPSLDNYFIDYKNIATYKFLRQTSFYRCFTKQSTIALLTDDKANKILSFFQTKFPLTRWGKIDWDKIEKKLVIGRDPSKIVPALEQLFGKPVSMTAYINWCDADFPLVKIDLREAVTRYDQIVAVTLETVLFNPTARYVIETNIFGDITVGVLHKEELKHA